MIVEATNDIIARATQLGYLDGRIVKAFRYFDDEQKDVDSNNNAHLIYTQCFARQIPWVIQQRIESIAKDVKARFTVLIISPTKVQSRAIVDALKGKGFRNLYVAVRNDLEEPTLLDGLKLLLKDKECNLGWRMVAKKLLEVPGFETVLKRSHEVPVTSVVELIPPETRGAVTEMLATLRAVRDEKQTDNEALSSLLKAMELDAYAAARDSLREELNSSVRADCNRAIRNIHITATTIPGAKGLAADYVFITHFDDRYFIKNRDERSVSDQDICNLLVALTRAKMKIFLISSDPKKTPLFLEWIDKERIRKTDVGRRTGSEIA